MADNTNNGNNQYIQNLILTTRRASEEGMKKAVIFAQAEAQKLAADRIYAHPVPRNKDGTPKYVRTGLYKSSIKGYVKKAEKYNIEGAIESPVVYAKWLEYKCQKMCLTDAVLNNQEQIKEYIREKITSNGTP